LYNFFVIATPIGNYKDITIRAIEILKELDFIVCEEEREYKRLFGYLNIPPKKFILCNEHNEDEAISLTIELLKKGEKGGLISDCGTPLFEDPGYKLISSIRANNFKITGLPGPNSLILALSLSPFKIKDFYFVGFLPRKLEERESKLLNILKRKEAIILMEAPYRLPNILESLKKYLKERRVFIPYNLTMEDEKLFYGSISQVEKQIIESNVKKGEFLIIIEGKL